MDEFERVCLNRFVRRQQRVYDTVLAEIKAGKKEGCWIWFIFPQLLRVEMRSKARHYSIKGIDEATEYLQHPVLGQRLKECCTELLKHENTSILNIMGEVDAKKLQSSMTLFEAICHTDTVFTQVLEQFYNGERDSETLLLLDIITKYYKPKLHLIK